MKYLLDLLHYSVQDKTASKPLERSGIWKKGLEFKRRKRSRKKGAEKGRKKRKKRKNFSRKKNFNSNRVGYFMNLSISFSLCCHYPNLNQYHLYCSLTTGSPHFYYWTPYCFLDQRVRVIFLKFLEIEPDPEITKFRSHSCNRCTGRVQKGGSSICFSPFGLL